MYSTNHFFELINDFCERYTTVSLLVLFMVMTKGQWEVAGLDSFLVADSYVFSIVVDSSRKRKENAI